MITYKRVITCPHSVEVEIYNSYREVGKSYGGRGVNRSLSSEKQRKANELRAVRDWERVIDCNFSEEDYFCRFSAPFGTFTDERSFMQHVQNFFKRVSRECRKREIAFKYIGFRECGKLGKNWHLHVVLSKEAAAIAKCKWYYKNGGMNFTPLWDDHSYEKLAAYIRKDITGKGDEDYPAKKRMMASRNLKRPEVTVKKCNRTEVRKLERGDYLEPPKGFHLDKDELAMSISDITGASWYFKFRPLVFPKKHR